MKLEDIPKKTIFNVPDGYFDQLPAKIRSRVSENSTPDMSFVFRYKLQYFIPAVFVFAVGLLWLSGPKLPTDAESILADVETEYLIAFLNESELTTEDLLEEAEFSSNDIQEIEMEIYQLELDDKVFDDAVEEIDVENL